VIIATKDGKRYEITSEDQQEILRLFIANGYQLMKAIAEFHERKFGEPFDGDVVEL
jgi:hypothetical protein